MQGMSHPIEGLRVLVTGGAGFIGSHLTEELVRRGCEVTVLDDLSIGRPENLGSIKDSVRLVVGSVANLGLVRRLLDVDVVFHLAAVNLVRSVENPWNDLFVNAEGTLNILEVMKDRQKRPIMVFASTGSVYGEPKYSPQDEGHPLNPSSPYGVSKVAAELYVRGYSRWYGLNTVTLRLYNVVGTRQDYSKNGGVVPIFLKQMLQNKAFKIEGDGSQERCFTDVSDVVQAMILAAETEETYGQSFNVATDEVTTVLELANLVNSLAEKPCPFIFAAPRVGDIHSFRPCIKRAEQVLHYRPRLSLKDSLPRIVEWMKCELAL